MGSDQSAALSNTQRGVEDVRETVGLDWLLDQRGLNLRAVHIPAHEPRITWAHSIELDDPTPYLRGGELVLTTGVRLPRGRAAQTEYVDRLVAVGAAGLGFGTGVRYEAVPPALVGACVERDLCLVEVPLRTPFMAIAQAIADRLGELRRLRLIDTLDAQRALTRAALRGGVESVVRTLARQLRAGVYVADRSWREVARGGAAAGLPDRVTSELTAGRRGTFGESTLEGWFEMQALGERRSTRLGWLAVTRPLQLSVPERLVLTHGVSLVALLLDRSGQVQPNKAEAALVHVLRGGEAGDVGGQLGLEDGVVALLVSGDPGRISEAVEELRDNSSGLLLGAPGDETILLTPAGQALALATRLVAAAGPGARAGLGPSTPLAECARSLDGARVALNAAAEGEVLDSEDLPALGFLRQEEVREAVRAATADTLRPLREADRRGDLVPSLRAYLDHHGNWDRASSALGIHRHTLRHRMDRVEDLTGLSLDKPEDRLTLHLGLLVDG